MAKPNHRVRSAGRRSGDRMSHARLRHLSSALQSVREQERAHIARELHDDTGQMLTLLRLDLAELMRNGALGAEAQRLLRTMDERILGALTSLRRIASNLRPRALDEGDLYLALHALCREFGEHHGVRCDLCADEDALQLDDQLSTATYRLVQEALTNIARHAQARQASVSLYRTEDDFLITIEDDGRGIDADDLKKPGALGLVGMRERVWALHGDINIGLRSPCGTRIDITLPLDAERLS